MSIKRRYGHIFRDSQFKYLYGRLKTLIDTLNLLWFSCLVVLHIARFSLIGILTRVLLLCFDTLWYPFVLKQCSSVYFVGTPIHPARDLPKITILAYMYTVRFSPSKFYTKQGLLNTIFQIGQRKATAITAS